MIPQLRGANAILTGGSQGLGPLIARELALAGVNLVLAARSADKLKAVADEVAALGVAVVSLPTDLTREADRLQLIRRAEDALGPIDLLINNAAIEPIGGFIRKTPAEIEQTVTTNVTAPAVLARAVLPGMIERRRGHIVNMASLAGKLGLPYNAIYGATKAALIAWSDALRVELDGTGVSVSVIAPGYVTEAGMFSRHNATAPGLLGSSSPGEVVRGVMRALQNDLNEVVVNPRPFAPLHALYVLAPGFVIGAMKRLGILGFLKKTYDV
jgi:short-subunit dehydrogenase